MDKNSTRVTRRSFVAGAAALAAAAGAPACLANPALADEVDTASIAWDDEADYVIVGSGAAGQAAAATCGLESLGSALILEAAPEELRGGNSRVCGQAVFCPTSVEGAIAYQTDLNRPYAVDEKVMRAWAENICENGAWLQDQIGASIEFRESAEFPEAEASDTAGYYRATTMHDDEGNGLTWLAIADKAEELGARALYNERAVYLIHDAESGEVQGVACEDGRLFKARKAVILACGGFEWNGAMMDMLSPSGYTGTQGSGTIYNRGDGIKMAQALGADLWNMNSFSGKNFAVKVGEPDDSQVICPAAMPSSAHDYLFLDRQGKRFMYEESNGLARHGKMFEHGTWADIRYNAGDHVVMGQACFEAGDVPRGMGFSASMPTIETWLTNAELLEHGVIVRSDTVAELAAAIGCDEAVLQETLDTYNAYAEAGDDEEFHRGTPLARADDEASSVSRGAAEVQVEGFDLVPIEPPYYSFEMMPFVINTQGGPRRDETGSIVDVSGEPIPRLFGAGEMGCEYVYRYNVGGNFSEAISSGRLAMRSASKLEPWE